MGQEKRPFGMRLESELYGQIERQAKREGRTPANLGEVLLRWAFRQLDLAGDSLRLIELDVIPVDKPGEPTGRSKKSH